MFAALIACAATLWLAEESPLTGKPCPPLDLERQVQSTTAGLADLHDCVAVIELFQLGGAESFAHGLPLLQKLTEKHAKEPRVAVLGIATDWPKGSVAGAADDAKVRAELASKRFYFRVMRDRDGAVAKAFALGGKEGAPRTVVLDHDGIVRWHGSVRSADDAAKVEQLVDELLAAYWVAPIAGLPPELDAYAKGDLPKAASAARRIASDAAATPESKAAAAKVDAAIEAGARKLLDAAKAARTAGFADRARDKLVQCGQHFALVPAATEAAALLEQWKADKLFQRELAGEVLLRKTMERLSQPKDVRAQVRKRLDDLAAMYHDTALVARIAQARATLD
jgi:hypothetical protein